MDKEFLTRFSACGNWIVQDEAKNCMIRRGNQSSDPGYFPETNPTWPPSRGKSKVTEAETSSALGSADGGKKGSLRALINNAGTRICFSHGLLLERVQSSTASLKPCTGAV